MVVHFTSWCVSTWLGREKGSSSSPFLSAYTVTLGAVLDLLHCTGNLWKPSPYQHFRVMSSGFLLYQPDSVFRVCVLLLPQNINKCRLYARGATGAFRIPGLKFHVLRYVLLYYLLCHIQSPFSKTLGTPMLFTLSSRVPRATERDPLLLNVCSNG